MTVPVIPLKDAAKAAGMTRDALKAALGGRCIIVAANKLGVRPADLEAVAPGTSAGLRTVNPVTDACVNDPIEW